ncbi:hypothetical protein BDC45DRAFT_535996 [Circinella umbellata]|nr:hypothetical protein BDC45DRAFT_535996 [Circinella umbellata]
MATGRFIYERPNDIENENQYPHPNEIETPKSIKIHFYKMKDFTYKTGSRLIDYNTTYTIDNKQVDHRIPINASGSPLELCKILCYTVFGIFSDVWRLLNLPDYWHREVMFLTVLIQPENGTIDKHMVRPGVSGIKDLDDVVDGIWYLCILIAKQTRTRDYRISHNIEDNYYMSCKINGNFSNLQPILSTCHI